MYKFIELNRGFGFIWCTSLHKRKDEKSQAGLFNNSWCICFCSLTNGCILPTHCHQLSVHLLCSILDIWVQIRETIFWKMGYIVLWHRYPSICPFVILEGEPAPALEFVREMYKNTYFICFRPKNQNIQLGDQVTDLCVICCSGLHRKCTCILVSVTEISAKWAGGENKQTTNLLTFYFSQKVGLDIAFRARLFKTNEVVSYHFIKISNVYTSNTPTFLVKKCEKLLQCKSFSHFCNKNY